MKVEKNRSVTTATNGCDTSTKPRVDNMNKLYTFMHKSQKTK